MQESDEDSSCSDDATSSEAADSSGPSSAAVSSGDLEEMISEAEGFGDENSLDSEEPDSESALKPSSFVKAKKDDSEAETIKSTAKDPEPTPTKVDAGNRKDKKEKKEKKEKDSKKQKKEKKDSPAALKPQAIEGLASSVATADSEAKKLYANANRNLP